MLNSITLFKIARGKAGEKKGRAAVHFGELTPISGSLHMHHTGARGGTQGLTLNAAPSMWACAAPGCHQLATSQGCHQLLLLQGEVQGLAQVMVCLFLWWLARAVSKSRENKLNTSGPVFVLIQSNIRDLGSLGSVS